MTDTSRDRIWKPHKRQEAFVSLPDTIFEGLYGGAAGGGKSEVLVLLPILRGFYKHPRFKGIIFRRTYPELESEIIVRSQHFYKPTGGVYNAEKRRWTWPSGAIMQFGHAEYEADIRKYDTAEYNYMAFDELTSFTEGQYKYLAYSRCRSSSRDLPAIVRSATNPGNIGHGWVRKHFIEAGPYGTILVDKRTGLKRIFIQSKVSDNPYIDQGYAQRLHMLPEAEKRAKYDGDWWTFSGQVFGEWRDTRFHDEPENAVHVIAPYTIPEWYPRILAVDWGFSAMTYALWGAITPDSRFVLYREYAVKETKISDWSSEIGQLSKSDGIESVVMCRSAWQNKGEELTIAQQFEKYSGLQARPANNNRIGGKVLIQEYLRWRPREVEQPRENFSLEYSMEILRKSGLNAYNEYMKSFEPKKPETNLPKLQVFNTLTELRKCIPLCIYDKPDTSGKPSEDVAEFAGDDPYDTLRYAVEEADRLITSNEYNGFLGYEADSRARRADIINKLVSTGDQTAFYNRMEFLERQTNFPKSVRRFHRAVAAY